MNAFYAFDKNNRRFYRTPPTDTAPPSEAMMAITTTSLPRIAVIGTGGTISSIGTSSLDVLDYPDFGQKLSCEALLDRFPETRLVADPVPITLRQVGSTEIGPKEWVELRELIHRIAGDDPTFAGF